MGPNFFDDELTHYAIHPIPYASYPTPHTLHPFAARRLVEERLIWFD